MPVWVMLCAAVTSLSATGFMVLAFLWLRKLRTSVTKALEESSSQQIQTAEHLSDAIALLQNRQRQCEQQVQTLAQAGLRLQQELVSMSTRLEHNQGDAHRGDQTLH